MATAELENPYEQRLEAQRRLLADPMRQSQAQRENALALLGMLSGDEALGNVGGAMLTKAARQQQREDDQALRLEDKAAAYSGAYAEARQRTQERQEAAEAQRQFQGQQNELMRRALAGNQGLVQVMGPNGAPMWVQRPDAIGQQPVPAGGGKPTVDEAQSASRFNASRNAMDQVERVLKENPEAAQPNFKEYVTGKIPVFGEDAAYGAMTPQRQQFVTAMSTMGDAFMHDATGAGASDTEARRKLREITPVYGEHPATTSMKMQTAKTYLEGLRTRAGSAAPGFRPGGLPKAAAAARGASAPGRTVSFADLPD
ncbi:hypothetical protein ACVNIS_06450 [Sphaerotilaceae bacterium SBD11-9]